MAFQAPSIVQEHEEEKNPGDKLLLADPNFFSNLEFVNSQQIDYNICTNVPFALVNITKIS